MNVKIKYSILQYQSRFLRIILSLIGLAGIVMSCGIHQKQSSHNNLDSLDSIKQQNTDSIVKLREDSITQAKNDSISKIRPTIVNPTYVPPEIQTTDYGVLPYQPSAPTQTRYGSPSIIPN